MTERLPLFPLGTVLYPGLLLPLHIFEPRYRRLVHDLVALPDDEPRRFGVIAIREGREVGADGVRALHEVGCAAEVRQVTAYDDGRFDLVTTGTARFRLQRLDDASAPYFTGEVDFLAEAAGAEASVLSAGVGRLFLRYRAALLAARGEPSPDPDLPANPVTLSYLVAAALVLDVSDKQRLLAAENAADRLRAELALLRREAAVVRRLPSLPALDLVRSPVGPN